MNPPIDTPAGVTQPEKACANCGAPMLGPFCYACGQPEKGMVRHLASVLADVGDTIFNVDSRIFRSILPLYFRPGFLTREYFGGRRTRYVTPFRLFFFLCIIAFFAIQFSINLTGIRLADDDDLIDNAQSVLELQRQTDAALHALEARAGATGEAAITAKALQKASAKVQTRSERRLAWLKKRQAAADRGEPPPADPNVIEPFKPPQVHLDWLPSFANAQIDAALERANQNFAAARHDPAHLIAGMFSLLPQTLFVLMPLFALLLKITYLFKRRLYMEHLMVALHSHAFICLSLLLLAIVQLLIDWTADNASGVGSLLRMLRAAIWIWLPVYLFLMQKRIYRQGWFMTSLKYGFVGICYLVILGFGLSGAAIVSLAIG